MNINLNKNDLNKLDKLIIRKNKNIDIANLLNDFYFYSHSFSNNDYLNKIYEIFELDYNDLEVKDFIEDYLLNAFQEEKISDYTNNAYFKNVLPLEKKIKEYHLHYLKFNPYEVWPSNDIEVDENDFKENYHIGYFKEEFTYLALDFNGVTWMNITPNEINSMDVALKYAHGKVLMLGLGLGYALYNLANKSNITSITVIEKDQNIINIFLKFIYPFFKTTKDIKIIKDDAFIYLKNNKIKYDFTFVDIYHNPNDGLPIYLKLNKYFKSDVSYWLFDSLICYYRRLFLLLIEEKLNGYTKKDYANPKNNYEKLLLLIYEKSENLSFSSYEEIYEFLKKENLIKFINEHY